MIPFLSSLSLIKLDNLNRDYGIDQNKTIITQISFEKVPENQLLNLSYKFIRKHITE